MLMQTSWIQASRNSLTFSSKANRFSRFWITDDTERGRNKKYVHCVNKYITNCPIAVKYIITNSNKLDMYARLVRNWQTGMSNLTPQVTNTRHMTWLWRCDVKKKDINHSNIRTSFDSVIVLPITANGLLKFLWNKDYKNKHFQRNRQSDMVTPNLLHSPYFDNPEHDADVNVN